MAEAGPPAAAGADGDPERPRPTGRRNARLGQTVGDMIRSLVVVLVVVGAILLVTWRPQPDEVRVIDPAPALAAARAAADYDIRYPAGLDAGWRPTSARWEPTPGSAPDPAWQVGFVTPQGEYAQVGQSATLSPEFVEEQTAGGTPTGETEVIDGVTWQWYEDPDGTSALVGVVDGVTLVVSGTADRATLFALLRALLADAATGGAPL